MYIFDDNAFKSSDECRGRYDTKNIKLFVLYIISLCGVVFFPVSWAVLLTYTVAGVVPKFIFVIYSVLAFLIWACCVHIVDELYSKWSTGREIKRFERIKKRSEFMEKGKASFLLNAKYGRNEKEWDKFLSNIENKDEAIKSMNEIRKLMASERLEILDSLRDFLLVLNKKTGVDLITSYNNISEKNKNNLYNPYLIQDILVLLGSDLPVLNKRKASIDKFPNGNVVGVGISNNSNKRDDSIDSLTYGVTHLKRYEAVETMETMEKDQSEVNV